MHIRSWLALAVLAGATSAASAQSEAHDHAAAPRALATAFGRAGDPAKATRTVRVAMFDEMRFAPAELRIKRGETVRFVVENKGEILHELVLGTAESLRRHAEAMQRHPGMAHDDAHAAQVEPGAVRELVWTFDKPGRFEYGCLLPGHFEGGMKGTIRVSP